MGANLDLHWARRAFASPLREICRSPAERQRSGWCTPQAGAPHERILSSQSRTGPAAPVRREGQKRNREVLFTTALQGRTTAAITLSPCAECSNVTISVSSSSSSSGSGKPHSCSAALWSEAILMSVKFADSGQRKQFTISQRIQALDHYNPEWLASVRPRSASETHPVHPVISQTHFPLPLEWYYSPAEDVAAAAQRTWCGL